MIGFFDSGFGGLAVLKEVAKVMPNYSFIYLGDNERAPYGHLSNKQIYKYTTEGVNYLFQHGAELVILACNTASAAALRKIQQEFLPKYYPGKRVLGIIFPTVEEINSFTKNGKVGILSTESTLNSGTYDREINKINPQIKVFNQACPLFVPEIEAGNHNAEDFSLIIKKYLQELLEKENEIDALILGCTHYAIIYDKIRQHLPERIKLVSQGQIVAGKLKTYLKNHPEIESKLARRKQRIFLTTKNSDQMESLASSFYGHKINFKVVKI